MSNQGDTYKVTIENWINSPNVRKGILSIYSKESFDYSQNSSGYEFGRQIALLAKSHGLTTRGSILRKKPNSEVMAIVKNKMKTLNYIIFKELEFDSSQLIA